MNGNRPPQTGRAADRANVSGTTGPPRNSAPPQNPQAAASLDGDHVTLLRVQPGHRAVKTITPDAVLPYDAGLVFGHEEVAVDGLDDLSVVLRRLEGEPDRFVIRARVKDEYRDARLVYRRKLGATARLDPVPRRWCALDFDHLAVADPTDVRATAAAAVATLPEPFQNAAHHATLTASAGLTPEGRIRLWFWLSRPTTGRDLKEWVDGVPVDFATLEDVTPCFTSPPILAPGVADPLGGKRRSVTVWCSVDFDDLDDEVAVPDIIAEHEPGRARARPQPGARPRPGSSTAVFGQKVTIPPIIRPDDARRYQRTQLRRLRAAGYGEGRATLTRCALKLFTLAQRGLLDPAEATALMKRIMVEAHGWGPDEVNRGRTLCDINRQLDWAWDYAGAVEVRQ